MIIDILIGGVQFYLVASPEQLQFNGSVQTIEWNILVYSTSRDINVSSMSMTLTDSGYIFASLASGGRGNLVHRNISGEDMTDDEKNKRKR